MSLPIDANYEIYRWQKFRKVNVKIINWKVYLVFIFFGFQGASSYSTERRPLVKEKEILLSWNINLVRFA